jgi:hypothetical protein
MTADQGFELHPGAANDITEIWEHIANANPYGPRVSEKISLTPSAGSHLFRTKAINGWI